MLSVDVTQTRYEVDSDIVEDVNRLRQIRINLVRDQLLNLDQTLSQLIERGIMNSPTDRKLALAELRVALESKIFDLARRLAEPGYLYEDEVSFFLDIAEGE